MKIQKRVGLFETNSSSEHTVTISDALCFERWRRGELLAKVKHIDKCDETNGNFWSTAYELEFSEPCEYTERWNKRIAEHMKKRDLRELEEYRKRCEEVQSKTDWEDPEEESMMKSVCRFDQEYYNNRIALTETETAENYKRFHSLLGPPSVWMTWDDFISEFKLDCWSTYKHMTRDKKTVLFGKYFHS